MTAIRVGLVAAVMVSIAQAQVAVYLPFDADSPAMDVVPGGPATIDAATLPAGVELSGDPGLAAVGGGALRFVATGELHTVEVPGAEHLGAEFTLAAFVDDDENDFTRILSCYDGAGPPERNEMVFDFDPSGKTIPGVGFCWSGIEVASQPVRFADDAYHHLAVTVRNGSVKLYLDGRCVGRGFCSGGAADLAAPLRLGEDLGGGPNEQLCGYVDDLLIVDRALSDEEIRALSERRKEPLPATATSEEGPRTMVDIGSRRELLVDTFLIDHMDGAALKLHPPAFAGIVAQRDYAYEGPFCYAYATVIHDGDLYRLYYRGTPGEVVDGAAGEVTCYAESTDGIHWTKPGLGLFEVEGTLQNNVVLANAAPATHNFAPFIDTKPGVPEDERYKALGLAAGGGLSGFVSPDGLRWRKIQEAPVYTDTSIPWVFDSQNVAFWSESEGCYVLYYRRCPDGIRAVARATSDDFIHWSAPTQMTYTDTGSTVPRNHLYITQTDPYFRAPHIYVATPARFMQGRRALTDEQVAALKPDGGVTWLQDDCSDAWFMTTRGGDTYSAPFQEPLIRPGLDPRNWVSRCNYPARGIVQTGPEEMSLYVQREQGQETVHLARYVFRLDGFASLHAGYPGGEMVTRPLTFAGASLSVNFATSAPGSLRVEIQDEAGAPIEGFSLADCDQVIGDAIDRRGTWRGNADVSALAGRPVRLRFVLEEADLYALQFLP